MCDDQRNREDEAFMPTALRTGKLPAQPARPRLLLKPALGPLGLPDPPASVEYSDIPDIGMLGNDGAGDCVEAGCYHALEQDTRYATGTELVAATADAIGWYSKLTSYDPSQTDPDGNNPTDQGTVVQDALDAWRKSGLTVEGSDGVHKIAAFAAVDLTNWNEIENAVNIFGQVLIGFNFPDSAMQQFDAGQPWTVVKGSPLDGGHCVVLIGYDADWLYVLTWGQIQKMDRAFWKQYVDEAWVIVTQETINSQGANAYGGVVDLATLGADFAALTGDPNPFPNVPPIPVPTPTPTPTPTPEPTPTPTPTPTPVNPADADLAAFLKVKAVHGWLREDHFGTTAKVARELKSWLKAQS
jgi:hypothetical protein